MSDVAVYAPGSQLAQLVRQLVTILQAEPVPPRIVAIAGWRTALQERDIWDVLIETGFADIVIANEYEYSLAAGKRRRNRTVRAVRALHGGGDDGTWIWINEDGTFRER